VFAHSHLELNQMLCKIKFLMNVAKLVSVCDYYTVGCWMCQLSLVRISYLYC